MGFLTSFFFFLFMVHGFFSANRSTAVSLEEMKALLPDEYKLLGPDTFQYLIESLEKRLQQRTSDSTSICNGRLTLTSGTAVTTSNVTAATSVYFTPYNGAKIGLYDGSKWDLVTFSETSVSVPATTVTPFDVFAYNNSGTLTLETVDWTNDTTRATALTTQNGVLVKNGAVTRRYLGTSRTTGVSGQTEDSTSKRFLWNICNRVPRKLIATSDTDSWIYTTATWRAANANTTTGVTRVEYVVGQRVEPLKLEVYIPSVLYDAGGGLSVGAGIGINSTSVNSADFYGCVANGASVASNCHASYQGVPAVGYSYGQWLEASRAAAGNTYWYTFDASAFRVTSLVGQVWQ